MLRKARHIRQLSVKRFATAALLVANSCTRASPSPSLQECVKTHLNAGHNLQDVQSFCYGLISGEQQIRLLSARAEIYEQQIFENDVLMWMVVVLTVAGVLLSAAQLWASYRLANAGKGALAEGGDLSVTQGSVAVKSSIVGVVILVISLAFFAIFVTDVYTIRDQNTSASNLQISKPPPGMAEVPK